LRLCKLGRNTAQPQQEILLGLLLTSQFYYGSSARMGWMLISYKQKPNIRRSHRSKLTGSKRLFRSIPGPTYIRHRHIDQVWRAYNRKPYTHYQAKLCKLSRSSSDLSAEIHAWVKRYSG